MIDGLLCLEALWCR